ncbi:RsmE family RNA methyltransferase [Trichloromonas sp.]|uniref:RsmE family RNA methyltransferase n=1 Tax=Trichloromonas sp. TaxID=3069249 RepID=UPI002A3CD348|nr:RsmE family RNA methyltransferase [Trichloromonas sp.]
MPRPCVNGGGAASLLRVSGRVTPEREIPLGESLEAALACWQARSGEIFTLVDGSGAFHRVRLHEEAGRRVLIPFRKFSVPPESPVEIIVYQALPEKERFELVLQKLTEIGVGRIVPYVSQRSATLDERDAAQKKSHRWPQVLRRAAYQCRRGMLPELAPVFHWQEVLGECAESELRLMLYEGEAGWTLKEALRGQRPERIALLVGPEGGFTAAEIEEAQGTGILVVSLGGRILRTETAAIVGAALLQYALGDLG